MGPWLKVLKTTKNEKKAKELSQKYIKKGYGDVAVMSSPEKPGEFQVAIFDETNLSYFDELEKNSALRMEKCDQCGKQTNENRFFKCINCGFWECMDCGIKRLFNNKIPTIHTCGEDDFEFLGNIGKCGKCGEPLGFRSIPQSLRARLMAKVPIGRMQMMTLGLAGCFTAEKCFIEKEILKTFESTIILSSSLKSSRQNPPDWLNYYASIKSNLLRMEWSASYILKVIEPMLGAMKTDPFKIIGEKIGTVFQELNLQAALHSHLQALIQGKGKIEQVKPFLDQSAKFFAGPGVQIYGNSAQKSFNFLNDMADQLHKIDQFPQYAPEIEELLQFPVTRLIFEKFPSELRC